MDWTLSAQTMDHIYANQPSFTCNFCYLHQSPILLPVHLVNAIIDAGGALVTPQQGVVVQQVGEGAVEQLEQLVPLHGEVGPRLHVMETHGIMHDVLHSKTETEIRYTSELYT